jgi:energy-coupling factor transporter ATP-binding protein EcfA2
MTDAGAPAMPPNDPDSAHQGGFDLGAEPTPPVGPGTPYRVLARKYRPASFDDLIGQEAVVRTVSNAFETGRIPQAWILTGVRGVGKTTTARILARALKEVTKCDKLNIAALGNLVPQLHVHIIARRSSDAAWPRPVWGVMPPLAHDAEEVQNFISALRRKIWLG